MEKNIVKLTEDRLRSIIKDVIRESLGGGALDTNEVMTLANIVVKKYGHGNCIDLNNPEELVQQVAQVMKSQNCDEYEALVYMSGVKGGGWG